MSAWLSLTRAIERATKFANPLPSTWLVRSDESRNHMRWSKHWAVMLYYHWIFIEITSGPMWVIWRRREALGRHRMKASFSCLVITPFQNEVIAWLVPSPSLVGSHTGKDILDWLRWLWVPDSRHRSIFRWSLNEVTQQPIKDKLLLSIYSQLCGTVWRN